MPSALEWITLAIAGYGAVVSSYLGFRHLKAQKPMMSVTHGWTYGSENIRGNDTRECLHLHAVNTGSPDIVVQILALDVPNYMVMTPSFIEFNIQSQYSEHNSKIQGQRLKSGDTLEARFDYAILLNFFESRKIPQRVRATCQDTLGNFYYSEWFDLSTY